MKEDNPILGLFIVDILENRDYSVLDKREIAVLIAAMPTMLAEKIHVELVVEDFLEVEADQDVDE